MPAKTDYLIFSFHEHNDDVRGCGGYYERDGTLEAAFVVQRCADIEAAADHIAHLNIQLRNEPHAEHNGAYRTEWEHRVIWDEHFDEECVETNSSPRHGDSDLSPTGCRLPDFLVGPVRVREAAVLEERRQAALAAQVRERAESAQRAAEADRKAAAARETEERTEYERLRAKFGGEAQLAEDTRQMGARDALNPWHVGPDGNIVVDD